MLIHLTNIMKQLLHAKFCFGPGVIEINKTIFPSLRNAQTSREFQKKRGGGASVILHHVIIIKGHLGSTVRREH